MGDEQRRPPLARADDGVEDLALGLGVEVRGGLVEKEEGRVLEERPREGEALPLAPRELVTLLADPGVEPVRQARHEVVETARGQGRAQLALRPLPGRRARGSRAGSR